MEGYKNKIIKIITLPVDDDGPAGPLDPKPVVREVYRSLNHAPKSLWDLSKGLRRDKPEINNSALITRVVEVYN